MKMQSAEAEERREYKRDYMRAWRADPRNRSRERANRTRWGVARKLRLAKRRVRQYTNLSGRPVCGLCGKRPPVQRVMRLRILANGEFERVAVPYCGQC